MDIFNFSQMVWYLCTWNLGLPKIHNVVNLRCPIVLQILSAVTTAVNGSSYISISPPPSHHYCTLFWDQALLILQMTENIQNLSLGPELLHLMSSSYIHIVTNEKMSFFFHSWIIMHFTFYIFFFICSSATRHPNWWHVLPCEWCGNQ